MPRRLEKTCAARSDSTWLAPGLHRGRAVLGPAIDHLEKIVLGLPFERADPQSSQMRRSVLACPQELEVAPVCGPAPLERVAMAGSNVQQTNPSGPCPAKRGPEGLSPCRTRDHQVVVPGVLGSTSGRNICRPSRAGCAGPPPPPWPALSHLPNGTHLFSQREKPGTQQSQRSNQSRRLHPSLSRILPALLPTAAWKSSSLSSQARSLRKSTCSFVSHLRP